MQNNKDSDSQAYYLNNSLPDNPFPVGQIKFQVTLLIQVYNKEVVLCLYIITDTWLHWCSMFKLFMELNRVHKK